MNKTLLFFALGTLSLTLGCSLVRNPAVSTVDTRNGDSVRTDYVPVDLFQLGTVRVPVHSSGGTLRSVIAQARDMASLGGAINLVQSQNRFKGRDADGEDFTKKNLLAGDEVVMVVRGQTTIITPTLLVYETAVGNVRIGRGDIVITLPQRRVNEAILPLIEKRDSRTGETELVADSLPGPITLSGDDVPETTVNIGKTASIAELFNKNKLIRLWGEVSFRETWGGDNDNNDNNTENNNYRSNCILLNRVVDGVEYTVILPAKHPAIVKTNEFSELVDEKLFGRISDEFTMTSGDSIHYTRLENIPAVFAGLVTPIPDRVVPVEATQEPAKQACFQALNRQWGMPFTRRGTFPTR